MKKQLLLSLVLVISGLLTAQTNLHSFTVNDINGDPYELSQLKGKKVMIVNVASKCGFTPQYEDLQKLYTNYADKGFIIIGFPANNFMKQEPGTNEEIKSFCSLNYGVTFPMMAKISVKGDDMAPLYQWLTDKEKNGIEDSKVGWNFQKYLIDEDGNLVRHESSRTKPFDESIVAWIEK